SNSLADMGGLGRKMPLTAVTFAAGALSLAGVPPFAGFASKDAILTAVEGRARGMPRAVLLSTALLTAFYTGPALGLTFLRQPFARGGPRHGIATGDDRPAGRAGHSHRGRRAARSLARPRTRRGDAPPPRAHPRAGQRGCARWSRHRHRPLHPGP